ncbi:MAG: hypothetical protein M1820_004859 [Bogoriella megaspora]|nr:MAG: hypothetical protein M1820_004859 [Bogoriella megaspora]
MNSTLLACVQITDDVTLDNSTCIVFPGGNVSVSAPLPKNTTFRGGPAQYYADVNRAGLMALCIPDNNIILPQPNIYVQFGKSGVIRSVRHPTSQDRGFSVTSQEFADGWRGPFTEVPAMDGSVDLTESSGPREVPKATASVDSGSHGSNVFGHFGMNSKNGTDHFNSSSLPFSSGGLTAIHGASSATWLIAQCLVVYVVISLFLLSDCV